MTTSVPASLRTWFVVHAVVDLLFAVPIMIDPAFALTLFGWNNVDPLASRLVGAALFAIGTESYLGRNASLESFRTMLRLKVLWSLSALLGITLSIMQGSPVGAWFFLLIFAGFSAVWISYWRRLKR
ncbi:MAG: hypothetical protein ABIW79_06515 [Gemmatimonas sp.]